MKRLWLGLLLFACQHVVMAAPQPQVPEQLVATHGYVYVSFPRGGSADLLTLQSVKDKTQYKLQARSDAGKSAFGLWVPAGEYRVAKWVTYPWGDYPTFQVVPGRVTNLGSLVGFSVGGYGIVVLPLRHPEVAHDVNAAVNQYRSILIDAAPIEWSPSAPPKPITLQMPSTGLGLIADLLMEHDRKVNKPSVNKQLREATSIDTFYHLATSALPPVVDEFAIDESGNIYYAADIGCIRVRHPDGSWTALDTGTLQDIASVEIKGDLLVAGTRDGMIRASGDHGATWKVLKSLPSNEAIVDIDYVSGRWLLTTSRQLKPPQHEVPQQGFIVVSTANVTDLVKIYTAQSDDFSDLTAIKEFPINPKKLLGWLGPQSQAKGHFFYVNAYPTLNRLDLDSMQWRTLTPPTEPYGFYVSPNSGVVSAFKVSMFSKLFVSSDNGESWVGYNTPPNIVQTVAFDTADSGWATRWNMGAFSSVIELLAYDRATDHWNKFAEAPHGCARMMRDASNAPKFCVTTGGSILSYSQSNWTVEFATE